MSSLRFALIGCGNIARKHAHALQKHVEGAQIGAFVDLDLSRAQEFSAKYGAPAFGSVGELMQAVGGTIDVMSPPGGPTVVRAVLPCG